MKNLFYRLQLSAFVRGELNLRQRRRIARQLDTSPELYRQYQQWRTFEDNIRADLPRLGQPKQQDLNRIWSQIQTELNHQPIVSQKRGVSLRYGFVALVISMMIVLPFVLDENSTEARIATQPTPVTAVSVAATAEPEQNALRSTEEPTNPDVTGKSVTFIPQAAKTPGAG